MTRWLLAALGVTAVVVALSAVTPGRGSAREEAGESARQEPEVALTSLAFRVHRMAEMERFYSEALGIRFRDVRTGPYRSRFGELDGVTIKLVPNRDGVEHEEFAIHQPGFTVADVESVIELAIRLGGKQEGDVVRERGVVVRASVRDPDGNTLELYRASRGSR